VLQARHRELASIATPDLAHQIRENFASRASTSSKQFSIMGMLVSARSMFAL
jgi:hypothetical protein